MKQFNKIIILFFLFLLNYNVIFANIDHPEDYAFYGILPGLGQFLLGNETTGALQLGLFLGFLGSSSSMSNRPDYIPIKERKIQFSIKDAIFADYLEKNLFLYKEFPFISDLISTEFIA